MLATLHALRQKLVIGFVGGSDLKKISEQLGSNGTLWYLRGLLPTYLLTEAIHDFDYAFSENGLTAYKLSEPLPSQSFIDFIGEERYKSLVKFILHYIADLDIPIKRYHSFTHPTSTSY
jgi:phosphomannomutase